MNFACAITSHYATLHIMQSIFSPAARRTISEQYENIGAATVGSTTTG
jgi:hypothetical protein